MRTSNFSLFTYHSIFLGFVWWRYLYIAPIGFFASRTCFFPQVEKPLRLPRTPHGSWWRNIVNRKPPGDTGLNVLAKNRRNWQVNFIDSDLEVAKTRFQTFLSGKNVLFKWKCQILEFHTNGMERGEVLKRYCRWQNEATLLKQTSKDRTFIHATGALQ